MNKVEQQLTKLNDAVAQARHMRVSRETVELVEKSLAIALSAMRRTMHDAVDNVLPKSEEDTEESSSESSSTSSESAKESAVELPYTAFGRPVQTAERAPKRKAEEPPIVRSKLTFKRARV